MRFEADEREAAIHRCLREVAALLTLPEVWSGTELTRIVESLAVSLFTILDPEFVYICVTDGHNRPGVAIAQTNSHQSNPDLTARIGASIFEWARTHDPEELLILPNVLESGAVRVATRLLSCREELGVIAAGFVDDETPTPTQHLLLKVAASQAVSAIQHTSLVRELHVSVGRHQDSNADLARRIAELQQANREIKDARRAALNVMADAVQAKEALRESQERLRAIVQTANDGIITIGEFGTIESINPAVERIFQYSEAELIGQRVSVLMSEADHGWPGDYLPRCGETGQRWINGLSREVVGRRKDGSAFPLELSISESSLPGKHFSTGILRDITRRKQAEDALHQLTKELDQRVASRTQELLDSQERLRALTTELNRTEQRERKRMAAELHDHLQQLLVLGKMKIGQVKRFAAGLPGCEDVMEQVSDILSEALTYTRTLVAELSPPVLRDHGLGAGLMWLGDQMKRHDLSVIVRVPSDEMKLPEEQMVLLFQSVRELLINVAKHGDTGQAMVEMAEQGGRVEITVRDEGKGFDLAVLAAGTNPNGGMSSKFGLFAIRERMRALGGSFEIQSEPAKGTRATLTLPLGKVAVPLQVIGETVQELRVNQTEDSERRKARFVRVLLVDDHAMVRQGLRSILTGYSDVEVVGEASNGVEALCAVEQQRPAVVIMDINMPNMDGIEATRRVKERYPDVSIIGLSVNTGSDNERAMLRAGAHRLLTKEAAVEQLYGAIQEVVKNQRPNNGISTSNHVTV